MSNISSILRLGVVLAFSFVVQNKDGSIDASAEVGNVDLAIKDVVDGQGNPVDAAAFATLEQVEGGVDKAVMSSDETSEGITGTFEARATVTWPNDIEGQPPITKELVATGTATLSAGPDAGDTLQMLVTIEDPAGEDPEPEPTPDE